MSRRTNKRLYVPVGGGPEKTAVDRFVEKYDLPTVREMLRAAALGVIIFVALVVLLLLTGVRYASVEAENGTEYRYFGWIYGGRPALGRLCGSDGTVAGVAMWRIYYSDGSVYEGDTQDFMRHGNGRLTYADGSVYRGGFKNDRFDGQGELRRADGSGYSGSYTDGLYDGQGRLTFSGGGGYVGGFSLGEMSGKGKLTYANGDFFEGRFSADMRAEGVYTWASGESIEGKFENNLPTKSEKIIYTDASGDTYRAYFINGELTGKSSYTRPDPPDGSNAPVG